MNCSEVMEQMQLKLDHMEYDHNLLADHMRRCPACAEMFERLTRLHQELVELPKVQPAFSLVDAIMPQLDELDREKERQAEKEVAAVVSIPLTRANEERKKSSKESENVHGSPATRLKNWFNWKAASGVVAAGLVVGLFFINYKPISMESADFQELRVEEKQAAVDSPTGVEPSRPVMNKNEQPSESEKNVGNNGGDNKTSSTVDPNDPNGSNEGSPVQPVTEQGTSDQDMSEQDKKAQQDTRESDRQRVTKQPSKEVDKRPTTSTSDKPAPNKQSTAKHDQPSGKKEGTTDTGSKSATEKTKPGDEAGASSIIDEGAPDLANGGGGSGVTDGSAQDKRGIAANKEDNHSLFNAAIESTSPDSNYVVRWVNGQLMLYRYVNESPVIVQLLTFKEAPQELKWNADSNQITVVTASKAGKTEETIYNVDDTGLHKVSAAPEAGAKDTPPSAPTKPGTPNEETPAIKSSLPEGDNKATSPEADTKQP